MRVTRAALVVCVFALPAAQVDAQSSVDDGIRAVVAGNYQDAARILKALADDRTMPDPVAQFFLGILYHTGKGVVRDESRACSLFLRAAAREHPFTGQSEALSEFMRLQLGDGATLMCVAEDRWQGGPPLSFSLGPAHQVVFADTSITVTDGDREQRIPQLLPPAAAFLPIQHTAVTVTRPRGARRDFFQWFFWMPDAVESSWTLNWVLSEVAGDRWIRIAHEGQLAVVNSPTPPASYDVSSLIHVQANASGEAEFTVFAGGTSRSQVIPSQGSR